MCVPSVRLREPACACFSAIRTPKAFNQPVEDDHPLNMSLRRDGSSQLSCHNQPDPAPSCDFAWNLPSLRDFVHGENANPSKTYSHVGACSEVDLMSAIYPLSVHRRIERQWAERINLLRQIHGQIVVGTERTLQPLFDSLIPVPVRAIVDRRQLDQSRPRD
jgi:hypothetical protein